jgi:hypothetical protein
MTIHQVVTDLVARHRGRPRSVLYAAVSALEKSLLQSFPDCLLWLVTMLCRQPLPTDCTNRCYHKLPQLRHRVSVSNQAQPPRALPVNLAALPPLEPETTQQAVYIGLGSALVSFALTFGVAPRFRSSFKEEDNWRDIYGKLVAMGGVESLPPNEAAARVKSG